MKYATTSRVCFCNTVPGAGLCDTVIARAMSIEKSLRSLLGRRFRVLDELQAGSNSFYERCSVIIFGMKCFTVGENVKHNITPFSRGCSWSLSTTADESAAHHTHTPPKQRRPRPIQTLLGEGGGGDTVLMSSKMGPVSTATTIPWCLPKAAATPSTRRLSSIGSYATATPVTAAATWYKQ